MTTTIAVINQPSLTKEVTLKCLVPSTFALQNVQTSVNPSTGADSLVKAKYIYNTGVLSTDTVLELSSTFNKDGSTHNLVSLKTDRTVTIDGELVEQLPIRVAVYWDVPGTYEDAGSVVDLLSALYALTGVITADGALGTGLVASMARGLPGQALG